MTGTTNNNTGIFQSLPKPNLKLSFGEESNTHIHFYSKKKPNKFQRWMMKKLLGIVMEDIE